MTNEMKEKQEKDKKNEGKWIRTEMAEMEEEKCLKGEKVIAWNEWKKLK